MIAPDFEHVDTWVFDLDNTLYPHHMRLFDQIERRMVAWMVDFLSITEAEANHLRQDYWQTHGTTLAGLMAVHQMPPEEFLVDVHDIDFSVLSADPTLRQQILDLPGRKIIYTNGTAPYAENVIAARGLSGIFDAIYGVEHANYRPKPEASAFEQVFALDGVNGQSGAMFEDEGRNLAYPFSIGMKTIHIAPEPQGHDFVTHQTVDLSVFLKQLQA